MTDAYSSGPYEKEARNLLENVTYLLEEQQKGKKLSAAEKEWIALATETAKAWATLNITDELTRFINVYGITINTETY